MTVGAALSWTENDSSSYVAQQRGYKSNDPWWSSVSEQPPDQNWLPVTSSNIHRVNLQQIVISTVISNFFVNKNQYTFSGYTTGILQW